MQLGNWGRRQTLRQIALSSQGSVAVIFTLMIPMFFVFMALYFDSVQLNGKRARLADAIDEGTIAISTRGSENEGLNRALLQRYLDSYMPEAVSFPSVSVVIPTDGPDDCLTPFNISAQAEVEMTFYFEGMNSFNRTENVESSSRACRSKSMVTGDFAFILDFSESMKGARLEQLKSVLKDFVVQGSESSKQSRFAIVPFDTGVTVKLPGQNERGGPLLGCSVVFVPKPEYAIDFGYWASTHVSKKAFNDNNLDHAVYVADLQRYRYYDWFVSANSADFDSILDKHCIFDPSIPTDIKKDGNKNREGSYRYSCMSDLDGTNDANPSTQEHKENSLLYASPSIYNCNIDADASCLNSRGYRKVNPTFEQQWRAAYQVQYWTNHKTLKYFNIANEQTIDYEATMAKMFTDEAVVTFAQPWTSNDDRFRTYFQMCKSIPAGKKKGIAKYQPMANSYANSYLIELSDPNKAGDLRNFIFSLGGSLPPAEDEDEIGICADDDCDEDDEDSGSSSSGDDDMDVGKGARTDTMTGLLRSVPVVAKGKNNFKSMIVIADGADNRNTEASNTFLDTYHVCDKIRDGLKDRGATKVEIYFILTMSRKEAMKDSKTKKHIERWTRCVGEENFFFAEDAQDLRDAVFQIMSQNREAATFY